MSDQRTLHAGLREQVEAILLDPSGDHHTTADEIVAAVEARERLLRARIEERLATFETAPTHDDAICMAELEWCLALVRGVGVLAEIDRHD